MQDITTPYPKRLERQLHYIENQMYFLLDISSIKNLREEHRGALESLAPAYVWATSDENQKRLQADLKQLYLAWKEQFRLLFLHAPSDIGQVITESDQFILSWIERKRFGWTVPPTIEQAKVRFSEKIEILFRLIRELDQGCKNEVVIIPDLDSLLKINQLIQFLEVAGQDTYKIVIVPSVQEELVQLGMSQPEDNISTSNFTVKWFQALRRQHNLLVGVSLGRDVVLKEFVTQPNFEQNLSWLDATKASDWLVASAVEIQASTPAALVAVVTSDSGLQQQLEKANLPFLEAPIYTLHYQCA